MPQRIFSTWHEGLKKKKRTEKNKDQIVREFVTFPISIWVTDNYDPFLCDGFKDKLEIYFFSIIFSEFHAVPCYVDVSSVYLLRNFLLVECILDQSIFLSKEYTVT